MWRSVTTTFQHYGSFLDPLTTIWFLYNKNNHNNDHMTYLSYLSDKRLYRVIKNRTCYFQSFSSDFTDNMLTDFFHEYLHIKHTFKLLYLPMLKEIDKKFNIKSIHNIGGGSGPYDDGTTMYICSLHIGLLYI